MDGKPSADFVAAVTAVADRLFELTVEDGVLRTQMRAAAKAILDATESVRATDRNVTPIATSHLPEPNAPASSVATSIAWRASTRLRATPPTSDADLPKIEQRCRLKAEATRWVVARQKLVSGGADYSADIEPKDQQLIAAAKAHTDCFLWMTRNVAQPAEEGHWNDVAVGFDVVADALALARLILTDHPQHLQKAMALLTEAQSALRCAIGIVAGQTDSDQSSVYEWLRMTTMKHRVFVARFMKADDPADPDTLADIADRIKAAHTPLLDLSKRRREQESLFRRIDYHRKLLSSGSGTEHDLLTIAHVADKLVQDGLPPSNVRLREVLRPFLNEISALNERPIGLNQALRGIEDYEDSIESRSCGQSQSKAVSDDVAKAKKLLKGQVALFVGGRAYPHAKSALEKALGLKELIWFETEEHKSLDVYRPYVLRSDVTTVFLAIRWSSHSYGELKELCQKHGKRFVRLTAGYNPNQVARMVNEQIGTRQ